MKRTLARFRDVIPKGLTVSIFKMRPMEFLYNAEYFLNFLENLKYLNFESVRIKQKFFYKIFWQLLCIYIKADLMSRNPKAIITSIDNCQNLLGCLKTINSHHALLSKMDLDLSYDCKLAMDRYYCQHLFCFGEREISIS